MEDRLSREELVTHREFVRALARRLVLDPDKGDDVAQDALLAALEASRPRGPLRRWLSGIVRNLAYRMLRGEDRRRRREAQRARPDRSLATGDVVADLELHREVVDALLALEEPYRTTLLLHFFEDLPPRAIAERQGIPGATVRSHLARGIERLRRSLDERREGWLLALLPFAFPARAGAPLAGAAGVAVMSLKSKLTLAALVLLALAAIPVASYWGARSESSEGTRRAAAEARSVTPLEEEAAGGSGAAGEAALAVEVRVLGPGDAPVAGASVLVFLGSQREWPQGFGSTGPAWFQLIWTTATDGPPPILVRETDALGVAKLDVAPGKSHRVEARKHGLSRGETSLYYLAKAPDKPFTIRLSPAHALAGRVLDHEGRPVAGATVAVGTADSFGDGFVALPHRVAADDQGRYAFDSLASGDVSLWASRSGGVLAFAARVRIPDITTFDIELHAGGTLTGRVTEKGTGRPVPGIDVRAKVGGEPPAFGRGVTNEGGVYEIRDLAPGQVWALHAKSDGYALDIAPGETTWAQPPILAGETTVLDLEVVRTGAVKGTVRGPEGPLQGVIVEAMCHLRYDYAIFQGKTDAQGAYRIPNLPPAGYLVRAATSTLHAPGDSDMFFQAFESANAARLVAVSSGGEVEKSFQLEGGSGVVEGRVEDGSGVPLAGVKVGAISTSTVTGATGDFRLENCVPGEHVRLSASLEGYRTDGFPFVALKAHETVSGVLIRLVPSPKREVRGRVHPPDGTALREPYLVVKRLEEENSMWRGDGPRRHAVNSDGTFAVELNEYSVRLKGVELRAGGLGAGLSEPVRFELGDATRYDTDLYLTSALTLKGSVVGEDGRPVPFACVSLTTPRQRDVQDQFRDPRADAPVVAVADAQGFFEAKGLAAGRYEYRTWARGLIAAKGEIDVPPGPLNITMEKALELAGRVTTRDGKPVPGVSLYIRLPMPSGISVEAWSRNQEFHKIHGLRTNDRGEFRLGGLKRGDYTITIEGGRGGADFFAKPLERIPAGSTDLTLVVEPGLSIRGRVVNRAGDGIAEASLQTRARGNADSSRFATTAADGSFDLRGLDTGAYTVWITARKGNASRQVTRELVAGSTGVVIEVDDTFLPISGTLVDGQGKPLGAVRLGLLKGDRWMDATAVTDATGRFVFEGAGPDEHSIRLRYDDARDERLLLEGGTVKGGDTGVVLRLHEGAVVEGIVWDEAGAPVKGIWVGVKIGERWRSADTDAVGRFRVTGLPADTEAQLRASPREAKEFAIHTRAVRTGTGGHVVTLCRGTPTTGRVLDAAGRPLAKFSLAFAPVEGDDTLGWGEVTDDDGRFEVLLLVRDYRVTARKAGGPAIDCGVLRGGGADLTLTAK